MLRSIRIILNVSMTRFSRTGSSFPPTDIQISHFVYFEVCVGGANDNSLQPYTIGSWLVAGGAGGGKGVEKDLVFFLDLAGTGAGQKVVFGAVFGVQQLMLDVLTLLFKARNRKTLINLSTGLYIESNLLENVLSPSSKLHSYQLMYM